VHDGRAIAYSLPNGLYPETVTTAIRKIELPEPGIKELRSEALGEGYNFVERLIEECATGTNRYDRPGETLLGCFDDEVDGGILVAVGGLNIDPFANDPSVGRVRRVYVRPAWRKRGIGPALVERSRGQFRRVRLRAENADAGRIYERMGFAPTTEPDATHVMKMKED
jgi:GNAT superfamily N-acetyltransferase